MIKSMNLYFNNHIPTKDKLDKIKEQGYDQYFTGLNRKGENISIKKEFKYAKQLRLDITMVHCKYREKILNNFWKKNLIGTFIRLSYELQMKKIRGYTANFVVHLHGNKQATTSNIGLKRLEKLLKTANKCNLNLCIENLYSYDEIPYIFKTIHNENLKICFDIGHKNCLTPEFDLLNEYGEYVSVIHIHDNNTKADQHDILGKGTVNISSLAKDLSKYPQLVLSAEIKQKNDVNYLQYIRLNYDALVKLESEIIKCQKIYNTKKDVFF